MTIALTDEEKDKRKEAKYRKKRSVRLTEAATATRSEMYYLIAEHHSLYSVDDRIKAAMLYASEGNLAAVARQMEIKYDTIRMWKDTPWWPLAVNECRDKKQDELDAMLSKVIYDAVNEISDRVQKGDFISKKDGTVGRLPMKGRELASTLGMLYDKRALIRGQATQHTVSVSHKDTVKNLTDKFEEFAMKLKGKEIEGTHEVEIQDGV